MKKIAALILKDTILRFSSPSEWLFFIILPVVFIVLLAGGTGMADDSRARVLVVDEAQSPLSQQLVAELESSGTVRPDVMDAAQAEDLFEQRGAPALLVIPPELTAEALQAGAVALNLRLLPNNTGGLLAQQAVGAAAQRVSATTQIAGYIVTEVENFRTFESAGDRAAYTTEVQQAAAVEWEAAPERLNATVATAEDEVDYDPQTNSTAGQMITWAFIPLLGLGGMFVYERQIGTLRRILVTPTPKWLFLFATILGQVLLALVQMGIIMGVGAWVMGVDWGQSPGALIFLLVASALAAAAIGTTYGAFVRSSGQATGIAIMSGMVMALLGGCWYPIELFPQAVQDATRVLPTRWAMEGILNIALRGQGLEGVLPHIGVLLGFAVVFFAIGVWRFKYE